MEFAADIYPTMRTIARAILANTLVLVAQGTSAQTPSERLSRSLAWPSTDRQLENLNEARGGGAKAEIRHDEIRSAQQSAAGFPVTFVVP